MSPEQASGMLVDFRSDQFSFGTVLYEMVTGERAFQGRTRPETLAAIIREEPESIATLAPKTPAPLRWIVERCLAKEPRERYASTEDLARELENLRSHLSEASGAVEGVATRAARARLRVAPAIVAAAVLAAMAAGFLAGRRAQPAPPMPSFQRLTFRRGTIGGARFAPDGQTIVLARHGRETLQSSSRPGPGQPSPGRSAWAAPSCERSPLKERWPSFSSR